jgi:hypothetical protein
MGDLLPRRTQMILAFLLLTSPMVFGTQGNWSKISAFVIGAVNPGYNPFSAMFTVDPQFTYGGYPISYPLPSADEARRAIRRYYPRSGKILMEEYEIMIFCEARMEYLAPSQFRDLVLAFSKGGMVGVVSPGTSWDAVWLPTILYELMPVWQYGNHAYRPYHVTMNSGLPPVFTPFIELGVEKVRANGYHEMYPREGATVWARMVPNKLPWFVSWRLGGSDAGMIWMSPGCFTPSWWGTGVPGHNPYAIDLLTNLLFYSLDLPLIGDIHARREARRAISIFHSRKLMVLHMMEWADGFGANVIPLSEMLKEVENDAECATDFYVDRDYTNAISHIDSMEERIIMITEEAIRLKNEAMFWIYVSEWLIVSSVAIISGSLLWNLMVRRKMYRETGVTRLGDSW